jgi:glycosyltransferase involved in cell wall biosynthesis
MTDADRYYELGRKYPNIFFHGPFKNPDGLPVIYQNIDLVLSTYDVIYENVRFAEPNKLYEAIYFEVPIIVSKGTYIAEKVERLKVGFAIDPLNVMEIVSFIKSLTVQILNEKRAACAKIDKNELIDVNTEFFSKL